MAKAKPKYSLDELLVITRKHFPKRFPSGKMTLPKTKKLIYTPFVGVKTFSIRGEVTGTTEPKIHKVITVFQNADFSETADAKHTVELKVKLSGGKTKLVYMAPLTKKNKVQVRCSCSDFYFRAAYYHWESHTLYGVKPKKYTRKTGAVGTAGAYPSVNPEKVPMICKHVLSAYFKTRRSRYFQAV